jgi:hypothetical protein
MVLYPGPYSIIAINQLSDVLPRERSGIEKAFPLAMPCARRRKNLIEIILQSTLHSLCSRYLAQQ